MGIPNSVRYFQRLNEMVKELAFKMKGEKMETNQSQYEKMCEVYERYNKGGLVPVVRCKDCEKWDTIECLFVKCDGLKFCAWGERREDDD